MAGVVVKTLAGAMRVTAAVQAAALRVERGLAGLSMALLDPAAQAALTARIYDARGTYGVTALFDWEIDWLAQDLPPPPSRLLVGGAGSGREVSALLYEGREVMAFDPAPRYVRGARDTLPPGGLLGFEVGAYEDLLRPGPLASAVEDHAPYDAVLLGWGSFTHVLRARDRLEVLRAMRRVCPKGPLLLSFWLRGPETSAGRGRGAGRAWALGSLLRGGVGHGPPPPGLELHARAGFGYRFTVEEIRALAWGIGDVVRRPPGRHQAYAHATLVPR